MINIDERLNKIEKIITDKDFRENKGLGNEVGYYVFDYKPNEELDIRDYILYLKNKVNNGNKGFKIIEFDLYEMMIEILSDEGCLENCFEIEQEDGFIEMAEAIVETLGLDETNDLNLIISRIMKNTPDEGVVVLLTGIGKCYPIIRSHNILNNLHQLLDKVPVVLFFPGKYSGQDLQVFGSVKDGNYYRAFRFE